MDNETQEFTGNDGNRVVYRIGEAVEVYSTSSSSKCRGEIWGFQNDEGETTMTVKYWSSAGLKQKILPLKSEHITSFPDSNLPSRSQWKEGSIIQVWSDSKQRWFNAKITQVNKNNELTLEWKLDNKLKMTKEKERNSIYLRHYIPSLDDKFNESINSNQEDVKTQDPDEIDSFNTFGNDTNIDPDDICPIDEVIAACLDLISNTNLLIKTIYESGDLQVIDKIYGKNRKLKKSEELSAVDPTTKADIMAQKMIAGSLKERFKNLTICGEEGQLEYDDSDIIPTNELNTKLDEKYKKDIPEQYKKLSIKDLKVWIDPIDGTKEFTEGIKDAVTTLVGIAYKNRPIIGFVSRPFSNQIIWSMVHAKKVYGLNSEFSLNNRDITRRIVCTTRSHFKPSMRSYISGCHPTGFYREGGCGGKVLKIIEGKCDAYVFPSLGTKKWDTCAPEALLLALGGKLTRPDGTLYDYSKTSKEHYMNSEGLIATVFGNKYHNTFLKQNITIEDIDLIVFGATGFTGKLACEYIIEQYNNNQYTFAFAGRSMKKLQKLRNDLLQSDIGKNNQEFIKNIKLLQCDALNQLSCDTLIRKCSVVVTTVGPYMRYGENIVKACCKWGVDYVDLTGEYIWVKHCINQYNDDAKRSSSRIISCGGVVSFPVDALTYKGVKYLKDQYKIDTKKDQFIIRPYCFMKGKLSQSGGTTESTFNALDDISKVKITTDDSYYLCDKSLLNTNKQPKPEWPSKNKDINKIEMNIHYSMIDRLVISRSNELNKNLYGDNFQLYYTRFIAPSWIFAYIFTIFFSIFEILVKYSLFRNILKSVRSWLPKPGEGPSKENMLKASTNIWVDVRTKNTNHHVRCRLIGAGDAGYYLTSRMLVEQGMVMVDQRRNPKLRKIKGGLFTPAGALQDMALERLDKTDKFTLSMKDFGSKL